MSLVLHRFANPGRFQRLGRSLLPWSTGIAATGIGVGLYLGLLASPPYYHNGACETLACVVGNPKHRTANGTLPDVLAGAREQQEVVAFLKSIGVRTAPVR